MVVTRGGGGDASCLSRQSSVYHVRLKSGQMISAQLQNAHRHRKGLPTWGDEVRLCWEVDSCVVLTV
ncbi:TOBE domain-containing protein [Escherichia coli]